MEGDSASLLDKTVLNRYNKSNEITGGEGGMGIHLHYKEKGNKQNEPLLLLHGNGEDGSYFVNQIEHFSKSYWVIAVDTRGHGKSPRGNELFTIRQFAEDLHNFMDNLNIKKANILGFSDGGNIALIFAMRYPERVNKLILNGANLDTKGVKAWAQLPTTLGYSLAKILSETSPEANKKVEMLGLMVNDPNIDVKELGKVKARTLVIAGTRDMIKKSHTMEIYRNIKNAEMAIIKGNHFIANRRPESFNEVVENFLL